VSSPPPQPQERKKQQQKAIGSAFQRVESRLISSLPKFVTVLRFRIFFGYLVVVLLGIYGWEHIATAWRYLGSLLVPVAALVGAVFALKLSVVFVSLVTLFTSLIKIFFGFLVVVFKPGILKAIFIPQVISLLTWLHGKSYRLQLWVDKYYNRAKGTFERIVSWWRKQSLTDKILLSGFIVPLLVVLIVVFIIQRTTAIFAVKKLTEQVVQKTTKFTIKHFHKIPLIGGVPMVIANWTRKLTRKDDRTEVMTDLKNLGEEIYEPEGEIRRETGTDQN